MNKLLEKQLRKYIPDLSSLPDDIINLLNAISDTYDHNEKDRRMLERSIELTSEELIELNDKLRTEAAILRDKETHLNASQHIAHVGSWEYDEISGELYWTDETFRIFGYEPHSVRVTLDLFYDHVHPDDLDSLKKAVKTAIETQSLYSVIHRITNGRIVHERAEIIFNNAGEPIRMIGTVQDITERIKSEEKLHKAHNELRLLFENMNDLFFSVDITTNQLIQMSGACEQIYGRTISEFSVDPQLWYKLIIEEDRHVIEQKHACINSGQAFKYECRIRHKDGSPRWIETKIKPTLDADGKLIRIDGITADISQRKETELANKNSEYKFRSLIENSADAIMIVNDKSEIVFASNSYSRIMGYSLEEVIGRSSFKQIHPEDLPLLNKHLKNVLDNPGKPITITYRRVKKSGDVIWCEGVATNLLNQSEVAGIVVNFRDITERRNHEHAITYSERKLKALLENSSEAVIVVDETLNITYVSDSLFRVAGYNPEDILGLSILSLAHPDEKAMIVNFMEDVIKHPGVAKKLIYKTRKKDGTYIWCERVTTNLLHDPAINGIVSNFMDITERIEKEDALRESNDELRKRNEELDKFVYSVSHDLRAPLTSILGIIGISKLSDSYDDMMGNLEMIEASVDKLDLFIRDILDYSKNTRTVVQMEEIDFESLIDDVVRHLRFFNPNAIPINFEKQICQSFPFCSDKYRMSIILNNLISNSIKYSNPDIPNPYIKVFVTVQENTLHLTIEDNGIGIESKYQPQIFDMFFRATVVAVGSGLGLYIVKETVKKLNGTIALTSEPGKGTKIIVTLPS